MDELGIIYNDGNNVCMKGFKSYAVEKITEQELRDIQNDFDPIEAPPGPYRVQPEYQGIICSLISKSNVKLTRKSHLAVRCSRDGEIYLSPDPRQRQGIRLLRG